MTGDPADWIENEPSIKTKRLSDLEYKQELDEINVSRAISRIRAQYAALACIIVIAGVGFYVRSYLEQFALKSKVDAIEADVQQDRGERKAILESMRSMKDMMTRMADQQDKMFDRLMPRDRGNGR